jgi:hypothetical protein
MKTRIPSYYEAAAAHIALQSVSALRVRFGVAAVSRHFSKIRSAAYSRACVHIARRISSRA